jgi:hypothetical protein
MSKLKKKNSTWAALIIFSSKICFLWSLISVCPRSRSKHGQNHGWHFCYDDEIRNKVSKEVATKTINQGKHK